MSANESEHAMSALLKKATETATADTATSATLEFRTPRKALTAALKRLCAVGERKSGLKILGYIALRADASGVELRATDLGNSITVRVPAWSPQDSAGVPRIATTVQSRGGICLPAKALADIVGKLPGDMVTIRATSPTAAMIASDGVTVTIGGLRDADFPKTPDDSALAWSTIPAEGFADQLKRVLPSICLDQTRFHLNGVFMESNGTRLRCVATDGHRLTRCDVEPLTCPVLASGVIVNAKGAKLASKMLGKGSADLAFTATHAFIRHVGQTLACKLIDAQYPPYDQVIPKHYERLVTVDRKALIAAAERAELVCSKTRGLAFKIGHGELRLACDHPDLGSQSETLKAQGSCLDDGDTFTVGMNASYLIEALQAIGDRLVTLAFGDELSPVLIRSTDHAVSYSVAGAPFLVVVMPMRI